MRHIYSGTKRPYAPLLNECMDRIRWLA